MRRQGQARRLYIPHIMQNPLPSPFTPKIFATLAAAFLECTGATQCPGLVVTRQRLATASDVVILPSLLLKVKTPHAAADSV